MKKTSWAILSYRSSVPQFHLGESFDPTYIYEYTRDRRSNSLSRADYLALETSGALGLIGMTYPRNVGRWIKIGDLELLHTILLCRFVVITPKGHWTTTEEEAHRSTSEHLLDWMATHKVEEVPEE